MRVDNHSQALPLTVEQRFFVSCWFNMVHEYSLDSHRVRTMNPRNVLREMLRLYSLSHANDEDKAMVCAEAVLILSIDPVLKRPPFVELAATLLQLLKSGPKSKNDDKSKLPEESLTQHVGRELLHAIDNTYLDASLARLAQLLLTDPPTGGTLQERQEELAQLTDGLLSTLIDGNASLESLFQLYRQVLVPRRAPRNYRFERKLGLMTTLLKQPPKAYRVLFSIDNVTSTDDFPPAMGGISFSTNAPGWEAAQGTVAATYLTRSPRRLFGELSLEARDIRGAGTEGYARISKVLDLTRFEYERERVHLAAEFLVRDLEKSDRILRYPIPRVVPNPAAQIETPQLEAFVTSVNELLESDRLSEEGRNRMLSAFRLYRLGSDTHSFDNKLTNWWTAVEFLVKGLKGGKSIGTAVESNLTPVLCLVYPAKLLVDIRQSLQKLEVVLTDPVAGTPIELRELDLLQLYKTLSRADIRPLVSRALAAEPYVQCRTAQILDALADPAAYLGLLKPHEQRVRWQIQRLWRARCDIVHSAQRSVSDVLLCANLEFYLKATLMSLLAELRRIRTLASPEEFFERKAYTYKHLKEELAKNSVVMLQATLAAEAVETAAG